MKKLSTLLLMLVAAQYIHAQQLLTSKPDKNSFPLVTASPAAIYTDSTDDWLVNKSAQLLQADIEKVTGKKPALIHNIADAPANVVIIGSQNGCQPLQSLAANKRTAYKPMEPAWETYQIQTLTRPFPHINKALVISGSDKRGVAYGVLEISKQIGVSPWYWWADVPVKKQSSLYIKGNSFRCTSPSVRYRGIFINDEAPAFSGWTKEKFGGFNHHMYEHMFELLLRLKGNYLWPAMWGNAFNDDDTLNPVMAHKWGIVMGSSHHEPMLRAHDEWRRYGKGPWNYVKNENTLRDFWRTGITRMRDHESIVTIGMRGDGDEPMTEGTATALLERIVKDQRQILTEITGKPAAATPQLWALYKEVQDYYDNGMRVPDDITLLLCDDNWGNIRKLPDLQEKPRGGGYGIYYHFDYVGDPRNYKWLNTNNIARVWEQMHLAKAYGADRIWIVNVGDLKPMEFPISFFLDYAWNTDKWHADNLRDYYTKWAGEQFGATYATRIGEVLRRYGQYAARRKPELLNADTYSLTAYNEFSRVLQEWEILLKDATAIGASLPPAYKDAYFQLVLHPVKAFTIVHQLYHAVALNRSYAAQQDTSANAWANKARQLYISDSLLSQEYNQHANGKWNHMMDQTHIGYTYWQQPEVNSMPAVSYVKAHRPVTRTDSLPKDTSRYFSLPAARYTNAVSNAGISWKAIPDIGSTGDGITTFPVTRSVSLGKNSPHLEYAIYSRDTGTISITGHFSPTLDFTGGKGLKYAVSVDNAEPVILQLHDEGNWSKWVSENVIRQTSTHHLSQPGKHIVKYWMISPGIILQQLTVNTGGLQNSYLPPPPTGSR
ncbi:glycosyl hydrolase 115 family protein [Chitinophaga rhizophila]|uniref:Glycosyl hydrolase 115 family protein n=1 Tax=Chitinophaga rhizophila TaxID=2866212 RepID=A0ABS7GKX5_9BACT|nr:glycosyl hydrolase 115 family protein [Chitinophaga rhizophila]MBW8687389.1 glycosyl hydrolase 115 family protein [Chitinophaga rhizophila]